MTPIGKAIPQIIIRRFSPHLIYFAIDLQREQGLRLWQIGIPI